MDIGIEAVFDIVFATVCHLCDLSNCILERRVSLTTWDDIVMAGYIRCGHNSGIVDLVRIF